MKIDHLSKYKNKTDLSIPVSIYLQFLNVNTKYIRIYRLVNFVNINILSTSLPRKPVLQITRGVSSTQLLKLINSFLL